MKASLCALACSLLLLGSVFAQSSPARPAGVPKTAFWVGGADGGVFLRVYENKEKTGTYHLTVYHDHTGKVLYRGLAQVLPAEAGKPNVHDPQAFSGWDGEKMLLTNGGALEPIKTKAKPRTAPHS